MTAVTRPPIDRDIFRTGGTYTISEAAKLAGTSPSNARRWFQGYKATGHQMRPVFHRPVKPVEERPVLLSFLDLAELIVAVRFRQGVDGHNPVKLERIREAHEYAVKQMRIPYPFATLKLREFGGHILREYGESHPGPALVALSMGGQIVLPAVVDMELDNFDYDADDSFANAWHPYGREIPVVVNPRIAAGVPTIEGTRITLDTIRQRRKVGESAEFIADDYGIKRADVEAVLLHAA